jgi:hypothetical protein
VGVYTSFTKRGARSSTLNRELVHFATSKLTQGSQMTDVFKRLALIAVSGVAVTLSFGATESIAKTTAPSAQPFLCNSSSDGSSVGFVNQKGKALIYVNLVGDTDYGGAIFNGMPTISGTTSVVTVDAIPTSTTGNLTMQLAVSATNAGNAKVFTVGPTSVQSKGSYSVCTFEFSKYGLPAGTEVNKLAVMIVVSSTDDAGGSVYIYNYTVNGTAISKKTLSSAGCLPL